MTDKTEPAKPDWMAPAEDLAAGAAAIGGVVAGGPMLGVLAATGVKALGQMFRAGIGKRWSTRADRFEAEVFQALREEPDTTNARMQDPRFQEVVFQNFRRAMDAIDPSVVPSLARLTAMYRDLEPDAFFRSTGRLLQDLGADELTALRQILSAANRVEQPVVEVVPLNVDGEWRLRFGRPEATKADREITTRRHPAAPAVLRLLDRADLLFNEDRSGKDIALVGGRALAITNINRLLQIVEEIDITSVLLKS